MASPVDSEAADLRLFPDIHVRYCTTWRLNGANRVAAMRSQVSNTESKVSLECSPKRGLEHSDSISSQS